MGLGSWNIKKKERKVKTFSQYSNIDTYNINEHLLMNDNGKEIHFFLLLLFVSLNTKKLT